MKLRSLLVAVAVLAAGSLTAPAATITPVVIGTPNAGGGDTLPVAFGKVNANFTALNTQLGNVPQLTGPWTIAGTYTFSVAPIFTDAPGTRAALGLGSVATHAASEFALPLVLSAVQTANATLIADTLVPFDATAGALVASMPGSPTVNMRVALKKMDSTANTVSITARFNGAGSNSTLTLRLADQGKTFVYSSDGTWYPISGDLSLPTLDARYDATGAAATAQAFAVQRANQTGTQAASTITGVFPPAQVGTGTPSTSTYLSGDGTWHTQIPLNSIGGATIAPTLFDPASPHIVNVGTLTSATTVSAPGGVSPSDGKTLTFRFTQDGTGGRVLSWAAMYVFPVASPASSLPTGAGNKYEVTFGYCSSDNTWRARGVAGPY